VQKTPKLVAALFVILGLVIGGLLTGLGFGLGNAHQNFPAPVPQPAPAQAAASVPYQLGVNFGGWLCLEDWFYSGSNGVDVSTTNNDGQGACLPPLLPGPLQAPWPSEGVLVQRLQDGYENAPKFAPRPTAVLMEHRKSFITEKDLDDVASLGVKMVRVPITWAMFPDALIPIGIGLDSNPYDIGDPEVDVATVPDPFYHTKVRQVTIPRAWFAGFLRNVTKRGFKVLLDLHAFPSGSSQGTYNGIYPNPPQFWWNTSQIGNTSIKLRDAGLWVVEALVKWVEGLDPQARSAVGGITVMNEPGHLLKPSFNPPTSVNPQTLLGWIAKAANIFRQSALPSRGVKLYVNLIETAIEHFTNVVKPWWIKTFTEAERNLWAVFDNHHYLAWAGPCSGRIANVSGGWKCDSDTDALVESLDGCLSDWAEGLARDYPGLRSCSEFSLGTFSVATQACQNQNALDRYLAQQLRLMRKYDIEPIFWTWKMPYGPTFENGWSYRKHAGLNEKVPNMSTACAPWITTTTTTAAMMNTTKAPAAGRSMV